MDKEFSILLDIANVRVLNSEINVRNEYIITVESTITSTRCRKCGEVISEFHCFDEEIRLRHLPILGRKVYISIRPKRFRCPKCQGKPTTTQRLDWYEARSSNTKAYEKYLMLQMINSTIQDVSIKEDIGYEMVEAMIERYIGNEINWDEIKKLQILGLDEIAIKKGHRDFVVIVSGKLANGQLIIIAVLPNREKVTVQQFLESMPKRVKRTIHTVCCDMYEGFINAAKQALPNAIVVADRYHVAKAYRNCLDTLRKQEIKRIKAQLPDKKQEQQFKGAMWALRKKPADLTESEVELLNRLFSYSPDLQQAYAFTLELTAIFDLQITKQQAAIEINKWKAQVQLSPLKCFDPFLTTLDNHFDQITNYFEHRLNSGFVEGLNNKIKVIKRRCFGIFNLSHLFQRISLDLNGYKLFAGSTP